MYSSLLLALICSAFFCPALKPNFARPLGPKCINGAMVSKKIKLMLMVFWTRTLILFHDKMIVPTFSAQCIPYWLIFKVVVKHYFISNNLTFSHIIINSSVLFWLYTYNRTCQLFWANNFNWTNFGRPLICPASFCPALKYHIFKINLASKGRAYKGQKGMLFVMTQWNKICINLFEHVFLINLYHIK